MRRLRNRAWFTAGSSFAENKATGEPSGPSTGPTDDKHAGADNPLRTFFERRVKGPGIWKWMHYFDIYHRYLAPFRGRPTNMVEVGVYSGGSLDMWRDYFGSAATIHGVDIAPECRAYQRDNVKITIGDQADPAFWRSFKERNPSVDVLIDDGGHKPEQQLVTLQEMLPHLAPGGVYICEDIHGSHNSFAAFVYGLADQLNSSVGTVSNLHDPERRLWMPTRGAQSTIESVSLYPYITVITKSASPIKQLIAPKHGTEWQPFLS